MRARTPKIAPKLIFAPLGECLFGIKDSSVLLAFARPAEHWSGARWPFGARGAVPGRAIKTEESLDSVTACGNAGLERIKKFQFSVFSFKVKVDALRARLA